MNDERIIAYLLEELTEAEQEQFEAECFARETWSEEIALVEQDLIDDYLYDALTPLQRRHFEQNYLTTPKRIERVQNSAALLHFLAQENREPEAVAAPAAPRHTPTATPTWLDKQRAFWHSLSWARLGAVAVLVVGLLVGGLWWSRTPASPRTFTALTLTAIGGESRGASERGPGTAQTLAKVKLPLATDALQVTLELPDEAVGAAPYRVELEDDSDHKTNLAVKVIDTHTVSVVLLAAQLTRGRPLLRLYYTANGVEQRIQDNYAFDVE